MIRRPGHVVNDGLAPVDPPAISLGDGFDLELSASNVRSWGGDEGLYRRFLGLALQAESVDSGDRLPAEATVLGLAAIAAWRAGVIDLRSDALGRLTEARDAGSIGRPGLSAALGIQASELDDFVTCQAQSPFGWPARGDGEVVLARIGGFRGLGGPWIAPPVYTVPHEHEGRFLLTLADGEQWQLVADIFGSSLTRAEPDQGDHAGDAGGAPAPVTASTDWPTRLAVFDTSYLAWLVLEQSA